MLCLQSVRHVVILLCFYIEQGIDSVSEGGGGGGGGGWRGDNSIRIIRTVPPKSGQALKGKNWLPMGANSFLLELDAFSEGTSFSKGT